MSVEGPRGSAVPILETIGLEAGYSEVNILHGVSISVLRGSFVSVIGPNGAGKSTLLKAIYNLVPPKHGRVLFRPAGVEHDLTALSPHRITELGMNYVPQLDNIFPTMSIQENLEIGAYPIREPMDEQLAKIFTWFPLLKDARRRRAGTLSGGQRHMLALARALMTGPSLLLLDEPSAGLAPAAVDTLFERISEINRAGVSIVMVEQNARRSLAMSRYAYVLDMGRNRFEGPGRDLLHDENVVELYLGGRGRLAAAGVIADDYESSGEAP
ncbi:MAG: ABC transporter ATP-binding protein [Actinomycetota bacterium]|nr:ABC transporter ATP-binding protein [Actinomycetota bacterium]